MCESCSLKAAGLFARSIAASALVMTSGTLPAEDLAYPKAKVSFSDYRELTQAVESHRKERLIDLDTFLQMRKKPDVIVLDTRSEFRFDRLHLSGAEHLNFSDFTQENLQSLIPDPDTTILIYCNNNFSGNPTDFPTKVFDPSSRAATNPSSQVAAQEKPRMMALNVPTYINVYGYGYRNVYELNELVSVDDPRIDLEGTTVEP